MSMNSCSFSGRLTADPRLDHVGNDQTEKVTFTLAVDRDRRKEDGSRDTDFFDFVAWRGTAKFVAEYFHKGDAMTVVNVREQVRDYVDKDGNKHRKTEHEVSPKSAIYFGNRRRDRQDNSRQGNAQNGGYVECYDPADDECPL